MPYINIDNKATPPVYQLSIDVAHDCTIGELLRFMETYNARLDKFEANGPAGGNPFMTFGFKTSAELLLFKDVWETGFANPVSLVRHCTPDIEAAFEAVRSQEDQPE